MFVSGAVLMALEIAGSRVLAPHFGNSVFVWGSLISVVLVALSLGYYLGGRLADRFPSRMLLNSICVAVSISLFGVAFFSHDVCEWLVSTGASERSGPLLASVLLFLPSSLGMGLVSPFALRLATQSMESIGRSSGTLYALSTVGSILGTMLMTFVLIPQFELPVILKGLAVVMLLVGILTLPVSSNRRGVPIVFVAVSTLAAGGLLHEAPSGDKLRPGDRVVLDVDSPYHHISVIDNAGSRQLRFDQFVETAIRKDPPHDTLAAYTNYFHLAFLARPKIERTLFIGAGGGVGPRTFHKQSPEMDIDVVDIDSKVLDIAQKYFFLEQSPRIRTFAQDGRMYLRKTDVKYDCLILDAFTIGGRIPFHLATREFFTLCRDRLRPGGLFIMNINSALEGADSQIFRSMLRTLNTVFRHTDVFALDRKLRPANQSTNIILIATDDASPMSPELWNSRARRNLPGAHLDRERVARMVSDLVVDLPDVSAAPLFTDDYAPIETMSF